MNRKAFIHHTKNIYKTKLYSIFFLCFSFLFKIYLFSQTNQNKIPAIIIICAQPEVTRRADTNIGRAWAKQTTVLYVFVGFGVCGKSMRSIIIVANRNPLEMTNSHFPTESRAKKKSKHKRKLLLCDHKNRPF